MENWRSFFGQLGLERSHGSTELEPQLNEETCSLLAASLLSM